MVLLAHSWRFVGSDSSHKWIVIAAMNPRIVILFLLCNGKLGESSDMVGK